MGTSDDDGSYKDGIESASSVLLLSTGIVALLISVHIALSIHQYGTKSASSKLVFMINCAQGMAILSKLPFVFNNIPYGCIISQFMLIYAFSQLWLVSYMMLLCTNHLKLNIQSAVYSSSDLGLNKKYELFLYLFPFIPIILPLSANAFEEKYNWCVTDTRMHNGEPWMLVQVVVFMIVIFTLMGRQCWVIYKSTQEFAHLIPPKIILRRILKGPFIYALVTILFGFVGVVLVRAGSNLHDSTQKSYYINYAIIYLFFGPAYVNFFIFFVEKRHLKVSDVTLVLVLALTVSVS
jgi:hypothetical protein